MLTVLDVHTREALCGNVHSKMDSEDVLDGGNDTDTISYANAASRVIVNLSLTTQQDTLGAGLDTISNVENLVGSIHNDTLIGDSNSNTIEGGTGNDALDGGSGIDTVSYSNATSGVNVDLSIVDLQQNTSGAGLDGIRNFEKHSWLCP